MVIRKLKFLVIICAMGVSLTATLQASPRLTLPETVFNFGFAPQNSDISHKFWLISTGDLPLKITNVIPGCSCTKAPLDKEDLGIGDSTQIEIIFSTKTSLDRVTKNPTIQTNEGPPDKRLQIIATIVSHPDSTFPVVVQPYKLDLSQKTNKTIDRIEFGIRNVSEKELQLELVAGASDFFVVELPKLIKPGELAKGRLVLNKTVLDKSFNKSFTFQVSDDAGSRFTVPVKRSLGGSLVSETTGK